MFNWAATTGTLTAEPALAFGGAVRAPVEPAAFMPAACHCADSFQSVRGRFPVGKPNIGPPPTPCARPLHPQGAAPEMKTNRPGNGRERYGGKQDPAMKGAAAGTL